MPRSYPHPKTVDPFILGNSASTVNLRRLVECLADSASTALITGETGTGKELVAKALHLRGQRGDGPFVPVNCGAIPSELIESELFGHRKGSFTGAIADRLGRFELAHGGTLFLDEVGDLPAEMQVKLLRVLQERCILPVGATREVPIDVRVIAATHKNLESEVVQGRFREDLYYRINVLPIKTTPLRERADDVAILLEHYAKHHARVGTPPIGFDPSLLTLLQAYEWPRNVRELANLVDRLSTLLPGKTLSPLCVPTCMLPPELGRRQAEYVRQHHGMDEIPLSVLYEPLVEEWSSMSSDQVPDPTGPDHEGHTPWGGEISALLADMPLGESQPVWVSASPSEAASPPPEASNDALNQVEQAIFLAQGIQTLPPQGLSLKQHLIDIERAMIEQALVMNRGNVSKTAKLLQLQRTTLIEKINKYELRSTG